MDGTLNPGGAYPVSMQVLVTLPESPTREMLFPGHVREDLESIADVRYNDSGEQFSKAELRERLEGVDVLMTGWGSPTVDEVVLDAADRLELVVHVGGSVAEIASPDLYRRGIPICSANRPMARFVAEGVLAYVLAALRDVPAFDRELRTGEWNPGVDRVETLFERPVGFVGLGTVGEYLLDLLEPFDVDVTIYDPYVDRERVIAENDVRFADLDSVLAASEVVSIHASQTPETIHLLSEEELARLPDGALLVNAARGAIVDEDALIDELRTGRISAVLDVFECEPLPADSELRALDGAILLPHVAGGPVEHRLTEAMIAEIERFERGEPLEHEIPEERFELMTRDSLSPEGT